MCRTVIGSNQKGYTLFIVLIMMLVIAFVDISNMQSNNTEMRISSNDADRKYAFSNAEGALARGEERITLVKHAGFASGNVCSNGVCQTDTVSTAPPVWERMGVLEPGGGNATCANAGVQRVQNSCYLIEQMGAPIDGKATYRVTARAWGSNDNTVVTLQSFVEYQE